MVVKIDRGGHRTYTADVPSLHGLHLHPTTTWTHQCMFYLLDLGDGPKKKARKAGVFAQHEHPSVLARSALPFELQFKKKTPRGQSSGVRISNIRAPAMLPRRELPSPFSL